MFLHTSIFFLCRIPDKNDVGDTQDKWITYNQDEEIGENWK